MKKKLKKERNYSFLSNNSKSQSQKGNKDNSDNNNSSNQNMAPFNISEERFINSEIEKNNPGPGSYFKNIFNNKIFNIKKIETTKDYVINNFPMFNLMQTEKSKKIDDLKHLIIDRNNKNQILKYKNLYNKKRIEKNNINIKLLQFKKEEKNISIPFNNSEIMKKLKIEPIFQKQNNLINEILYNDNHKNFIKIKKFNREFLSSNISTNTSSNIFINKQKILSDENNQITLDNISNFSKENKIKEKISPKKLKRKNIKFNILNLYKNKTWNKIEKNKFDESNLNKNSKEKNLLYEIKDFQNLIKCEPGPGYYSTRSPFDKYILLSKEKKKYNFGSNKERDILITKIKNKIDKNKKEINLKIENISKTNKTSFPNLFKSTKAFRNSISSNNIIKNLLNINNYSEDTNNSLTQYKDNINLGPGQYNIKSQFDINNSKKYSFPLSKRFLEEKISPGPGSYLALENWDKIYDTNINKKYKKIELKEKNENEGPDIYSYNSSFINSIEYNNYVKSNINYIKPPFGSSEERMIIKANSTTNMLSPCSYNFNDYEIKSIKKRKRLKYKDKYEEKEKKKEEIKILHRNTLQIYKDRIGPGSYNDNFVYNDWRKKTFNINYI